MMPTASAHIPKVARSIALSIEVYPSSIFPNKESFETDTFSRVNSDALPPSIVE